MLCPECKTRMDCIDTRDRRTDGVPRRRYACADCGQRVTTYEVPELVWASWLGLSRMMRRSKGVLQAALKASERS